MTKPHLACIFTGGTIGMVHDAGQGGLVPGLSGADILARVPELADVATWSAEEFGRRPGPHMTPDLMMALAARVREHLADPGIHGVVVTHGTDTLEETAFLLDLVLSPEKPVVLVGAMRASSHPNWDGPANLLDALRVAGHPAARELGVVVAMAGEIHAGAEVTKTHTESVGTFRSRNGGSLGTIDGGQVRIHRRPLRNPPMGLVRLEERVEVVVVSAGSDGVLIDALVAAQYQGIVLEGMGRGNVPPTTLPAIRRALAAGVVLVITSRCPTGRVLDSYAYEGAGRSLRDAGVLLGGDLPAHKARLKLMACMGAGASLAQLRAAFE